MENPSARLPAADGGEDTDAGAPRATAVEASAAGSPNKKLGWACAQIGRICECVKSASEIRDACAIPRPTCCYALPENRCVCVPNGGSECELLDTDPQATRLAGCPR
jgi:hypothetical protein